ncbi:hypothetical protein BDN72DRAFT_849985 [Pluteus cervinus]|uniref:Uncharacterized protein n=1 Tax=Pluteus cervinus TaxID=181527 RepID=A0ACD3A699_9AGAR|nr:hypothetical protein BDN72DRAFT_849985 [Pluteus cervinus]
MFRERQPTLPPELEEIVFSLCLRNDWNNARGLFLVAKRVYQWLIPQFYAVAIFHPNKIKGRRPRYTTRSLVHHGKHVRHMLLYNSTSANETGLYDTVEHCLSLCPNLQNVAMWTIEHRFEVLRKVVDRLVSLPHLTHLSIELRTLDSVINHYCPTVPTFEHVTHLELLQLGQLAYPRIIDGSFPALTHLSLDGLTSSSADPIEVALRHWKDRLKVVIWFLGEEGTDCLPEVIETSEYTSLNDPRVVILTYGSHYATTWNEGAEGGMGIWRTAEEVVKRRRRVASS